MDYNLLAMHLNTDVDDKSIGTESYRDIRNMRPYKGRFETIEGNRLLVPTTRTVIGSVYDSVYECNYFLLKDVDDEHAILRVFRTGEYDYILDNQGVLNFKKEISHIDVIDGRWLSFTDGYDNGVSDYNPPRLIDIHMCDGFTNKIEQKPYKRGQARSRGELVYLCINDDTVATGDVNDNWKLLGRKYTTISSNHITRAKNEPHTPPATDVMRNFDKNVTNLTGKVYKFAYTYTYKDGSESRLSPYSDTVYPATTDENVLVNYFNNIKLTINTGDELVKNINLHVTTDSDTWSLFKVIDKEDHLGNKLVDDNILYEYDYDGSDALVSVSDKTGFNSSPQCSTSLCFSSVGRIIDGNTTEFYDYQSVDFDIYLTENDVDGEYGRRFLNLSKFPPYTLPMVLHISLDIEEDVGGYPTHIYKLIDTWSSSYLVTSSVGYPENALNYFVDTLKPPGSTLPVNISSTGVGLSISTKFPYRVTSGDSTEAIYVDETRVRQSIMSNNTVKIGICYYDEKGRTAGVFSSKSIYIPSMNETYEGKTLVNIKDHSINISINSMAPLWAKYWSVVASKNNLYYEQLIIKDIEVVDGFIKIKSGWTYEDGDILIFRYKLVFVGRVKPRYVPTNVNDVYPLSKSDGEYIYIKSGSFSISGLKDKVVVEIRRAANEYDSKLFYETGVFGNVVDGKHRFNGVVQTTNLDVPVNYYDSFILKDIGYFSCSLFYKSIPNFNLSYIDGRPCYEDKTIRRTNFRNRLRWTGVYVPNGGVNKLNYNKFTDYIDLSSVHGSINHVGESNGIMSVKQNRKTTSIYVGKQGLTQAAGENYDLVVSSETVLGSRYESRTDIGCINPESYVKTSSGSYFFDKIGGRIVFDSQSGLQDISTGFINELIKGKQTIQSAYIGAPYYEVWFYLGNEIVVWSERDKKWIYRVDVSGIEHITNSDIILTCKDGIWVHNSSVRKLYNISINNKVSIQVSPVVRSTAKTLAVVASDSVDMTLSDSARLTNTPHGLAKKKDDIWYYPIRRFGDVHNGSVPRFDTALLTLNKQSVLPMTIHQLSVKLI